MLRGEMEGVFIAKEYINPCKVDLDFVLKKGDKTLNLKFAFLKQYVARA